MFRKLLAILLACLMLPCGPVLAEGAEALTSGDYEYALNDDGSASITKYNGRDAALTIPSELDGHPVTAIGDHAFDSCGFLTSVTIPEGVASIGVQAFAYCKALSGLSLPDSLRSVDGWAFIWCVSLCEVCLPEDLVTLGDYAFSSCASLASVSIPDSATSVGVNPFEACSQLTQIAVSPDHPCLETIDGVLFDKSSGTLICYPGGLDAPSYCVPE